MFSSSTKVKKIITEVQIVLSVDDHNKHVIHTTTPVFWDFLTST